MKKIFYAVLAFFVVLVLYICFSADKKVNMDKKIDTTIMSQENKSEDITEAENTAIITEEIIRTLVDDNFNCMKNIFILSSLPTTGEAVDGEYIYKVDESIFKNYAEFEEYIRSIYCKETADMLLYNYPYDNVQKYVDIDGALCLNKMYDGAKGYYVDWSNYSVKIISSDNKKCEFTLTGAIEEPAEIPKIEEYKVNGIAVYENKKWVLTDMIS